VPMAREPWPLFGAHDTRHSSSRIMDHGPRFNNWISSPAGPVALDQRAWFKGLGAWAGFGSKPPTFICMAALTLSRVGRCGRYRSGIFTRPCGL
jgi:hypothetical protein